MLILVGLYIILGAILSAAYYYLLLLDTTRRYHEDDDVFASVCLGILWPITMPFAFSLYFAKQLSKRGKRK